jgi:hypothetical protein
MIPNRCEKANGLKRSELAYFGKIVSEIRKGFFVKFQGKAIRARRFPISHFTFAAALRHSKYEKGPSQHFLSSRLGEGGLQ